MVRCRFWCSSSRWVNGWRRPTAGRRTVPRPCGYVKSSRRPWCRSVPLVGGGSPDSSPLGRVSTTSAHASHARGRRFETRRAHDEEVLQMTGFAVARRRRPQTLKWLDGLFDGLNLIAEQFNCAPDASISRNIRARRAATAARAAARARARRGPAGELLHAVAVNVADAQHREPSTGRSGSVCVATAVMPAAGTSVARGFPEEDRAARAASVSGGVVSGCGIFSRFSETALTATMMLEPAIERAAISGRSTNRAGSNTPAAIGRAMVL